ncbi:MAG: 5'-nucleotidase [bacterium]
MSVRSKERCCSQKGLIEMKRALKIFVVVFLLTIPAVVFVAEKKDNPSEVGETAIGDVVSDAVRVALKTDVALVAAGSLGLEPIPEKVTEKNLSEVVPFGNEKMVAVRIKGAHLRGALERSVSFLPKRFSGFLQVSGVSFTCDLNKKPGERVTGIRVGKDPLDDKKSYTVALAEYLAGGGNGYKSLREGELTVEEGIPLGGIVLKHAAPPAPAKEKPPARIVIIAPRENS